jgi:GR25 family glycosyltransferase involved in LPS biosynthesis
MLMKYLCFIFLILIITIFKKKEPFFNFDKGINSFERVLYINLKHRKDRDKQITNELTRIGLNNNKITRIDAVYNKLNGHIGCCKSHIKALNHAKSSGYDDVIIFEDDFIFTKNKKEIKDIINNFLKDFRYNWDVVMLTTVYKNLEKIDKYKYIQNVISASTSSAYIIQSHFYEKLIRKLEDCLEKMEEEMKEWLLKNPGKKKYETGYALDQCWSNLQKNNKWYIFSPYLGKQGGEAGNSTIMENIESFESFETFTCYNINL